MGFTGGGLYKKKTRGPHTLSPPEPAESGNTAVKMTVWCDFCRRHLSSPCALHQSSVSRAACKKSRSARSTKGASKVRRDLINGEIRSMRALLPIPRQEEERLSYLHSMAAVCTYIRKSVVLQGVSDGQGPGSSPPYETFLPALHGFILVLSARGKLVYVSENVSEYLGHSMVDVLQGDTVYDMLEPSDVSAVRAQLETDSCSSTERSFVCHMQTTKAFRLRHGQRCSMLVRGRFRAEPGSAESASRGEPVFMALCTPTVDRVQASPAAAAGFCSVHGPDMSFTSVSDGVLHHLGYAAEELSGQSWYRGLHPQDLQRAADAHQSLVEASEGADVEMVLRRQHKDLSWTWSYTRASHRSDRRSIHCTTFILGESEALYLLNKVHFGTSGLSLSAADLCPPGAGEGPLPRGCSLAPGIKRQRSPDSGHEGPPARTRRAEGGGLGEACLSFSCSSPVTMGDSLLLFTPPYSPGPSAAGAPRNEEPGRDILMDSLGYAGPQAPSPESSPLYYPYLTHPSPPGPLRSASPQASPADPRSSPHYGSRLVPDRLFLPDALGFPDPEDFSLLDPPQGGGAFQALHDPLTPSPSPTSSHSFQYDHWEHAEISILAQQISSLASSFDLHSRPPATPCGWPKDSSLPAAPQPELVLDDSVIDSILKELESDPQPWRSR